MVRGKAKLFVWLVSDGIPGLADLVAVTMQFVLPDAVKTFVEESNEQPFPTTVKETAPVPEPPEVLRTTLTADDESMSVPITVSGFGVGDGVGVALAVVATTFVGDGFGVALAVVATTFVGDGVGVALAVVATTFVGDGVGVGVGVGVGTLEEIKTESS